MMTLEERAKCIADLAGPGSARGAERQRRVHDRALEMMREVVSEVEAGIREAVRIMDLMGRGGDARDLARHGKNLRALLRAPVVEDSCGCIFCDMGLEARPVIPTRGLPPGNYHQTARGEFLCDKQK